MYIHVSIHAVRMYVICSRVVFVWVSVYICMCITLCKVSTVNFLFLYVYVHTRTCCVAAVTCYLVWSLCKWLVTSDCHRRLSPVESVLTTGEGKVVVGLAGALVRLLL